MSTEKREDPRDALARIQAGFSGNDLAVVMCFSNLGVCPDDITPRENVLTLNAWKAAGRQVAKGVNAIKVPVYVPKRGGQKDDEAQDGEANTKTLTSSGVIRKMARVFHISQTIPAGSPKGTRPDCLFNPYLMKPAVAVEHYGVTEAEIEAVERVEGYGARLSAPGYMDCTEWCVFETEDEAKEYLESVYGD